jgi:AmpD protein
VFSIDLQGWLRPVRCIPSPNCNERPPGCAIELLVIHNISLPPGQFGGGHVAELFTNRLDGSAHPYFAGLAGLQVSAHLLIERDGTVTQFVPFGARAWHAGVSRFRDRDNCNDFSIGIELEGADDIPYTDWQYEQLARIGVLLRRVYPGIVPDHIVGHSDIAPARKSDPGPAFDWPRFRLRMEQLWNSSSS